MNMEKRDSDGVFSQVRNSSVKVSEVLEQVQHSECSLSCYRAADVEKRENEGL